MDPAPFIEMGDDSTDVKEEDFDFSGAFVSSEKPAAPKSEKGRGMFSGGIGSGDFLGDLGNFRKSMRRVVLFFRWYRISV
jgi:hypothetical protein